MKILSFSRLKPGFRLGVVFLKTDRHFFCHGKKHEAIRLRFIPRKRRFIISMIASYGESRASFPRLTMKH